MPVHFANETYQVVGFDGSTTIGVSQCGEKILNEMLKPWNETLKGLYVCFRSSEYVLFEILDWRA